MTRISKTLTGMLLSEQAGQLASRNPLQCKFSPDIQTVQDTEFIFI